MKVWIGKPKNWFGPYQLAEKLCFWAPKVKDEYGFHDKPEWVHKFGEFLAHGFHKETEEQSRSWSYKRPTTWLYDFLSWADKVKNKIPRKHIQIDYWDTWSMDQTLAPIILPMLKQLKETKHGSAYVDLDDAPEHLRFTSTEEWQDQKTFDFYSEFKDNRDVDYEIVHTRWDWVIGEMIFAFEHLVDDSWEEKYSSGNMDHYSEPCAWDDDGKPTMYNFKEGPNHTYKCDYEGLAEEWKRVDNGLRLFGKYFRALWD